MSEVITVVSFYRYIRAYDGCADTVPALSEWKRLGAMTTKGFDYSMNTVNSEADDTKGLVENLVNNMDFTISGEGEFRKQDKTTEIGAIAISKYIFDEVQAGRQPTIWVRFDFTGEDAGTYSRRARTWAWLGLDGWAQQNTALATLSTKAAILVGDLDAVGKASENAANIGKGFSGGKTSNPKQDNLVKVSERRLALAKLEGEARARLQAQYDAADAGVIDQKRIKSLQAQWQHRYRLQRRILSQVRISGTQFLRAQKWMKSLPVRARSMSTALVMSTIQLKAFARTLYLLAGSI